MSDKLTLEEFLKVNDHPSKFSIWQFADGDIQQAQTLMAVISLRNRGLLEVIGDVVKLTDKGRASFIPLHVQIGEISFSGFGFYCEIAKITCQERLGCRYCAKYLEWLESFDDREFPPE